MAYNIYYAVDGNEKVKVNLHGAKATFQEAYDFLIDFWSWNNNVNSHVSWAGLTDNLTDNKRELPYVLKGSQTANYYDNKGTLIKNTCNYIYTIEEGS